MMEWITNETVRAILANVFGYGTFFVLGALVYSVFMWFGEMSHGIGTIEK